MQHGSLNFIIECSPLRARQSYRIDWKSAEITEALKVGIV